MVENNLWYLHKHKVRTEYVVIENLDQWLVKEVPNIHPSHPEYIKFWSWESKKCIEGVWGKEFGKYRFMPGNLYYFGNYGVIEHTWEDERGVKVTEDIKPYIVDFIWDFAYQTWVCKGFSGFEKDDKISCNLKLKSYYDGKITIKDLPHNCISSTGEPKKFEEPFDYLYRLHDENLGKSLFQNSTINNMIFGSRGSAKSYYSAIGEFEYNFIFAGAQRYDEKFINNEYKCEQCAGAQEMAKSSEMLGKFEYSQKCKTDESKEKFRKWFGIWVEQDMEGNKITIPSPFYKNHVGNLSCPNKDNKYTATLKQKINGKWTESGVGSSIAHVNYSDKKLGGERAAEGGRYLYNDIEEVGSAPNIVDILGANEGTLTRGGVRIGYQSAQGTSGNITSVQGAKKVFLDPRSYNMLPHKNKLSNDGVNGETCLFVPYYITLFQFKDKNGNTNFDKAIQYVNEEREILSKSKDIQVLRDFVMNKPCFVHEMWTTLSGYYLPYEEASERERELMQGQMYKTLGRNVELRWTSDNRVEKKILHDAIPITDYPIPKDLKDPSGCVVIYEEPEQNAPHDLYFYTCDPYVEEDIDKGGSLAVTYVWKNPKYIAQGYTGNIMVASYIGKPIKGLEYYYEQQEKLIAYYGNTPQGLWYDARGGGETLREYYIRQGKQYLLCLRPGLAKGDSIYQRSVMSHGIVIGNRDSKKTVLKLGKDWFLDKTEFPDNTVKMNIFRIPCIFLIRQTMSYNLDDNFDAVSAFYFMPLALNEMRAREEQQMKVQHDANIFENLLNNSRIFNQKRLVNA